MRQDQENALRSRRLRAVVVVLVLLVVAPGIDAVLAFAPSGTAGASGGGIDAGLLLGGGDAYAALGRIEEAAVANGADVPDWFAEEVGFLPGAREVRASSGGSVVGYLVAGEVDVAWNRLSERMASLGWTPVPLGGIEGATFVKQDGRCTWALVTCTQVGTDTSVVVRCETK